jgi:hypothetical protein
MWNWSIMLVLKKNSEICMDQMQNKPMKIHNTSNFESSFESSPSHICNSSPNYCYTKLYQAAVF